VFLNYEYSMAVEVTTVPFEQQLKSMENIKKGFTNVITVLRDDKLLESLLRTRRIWEYHRNLLKLALEVLENAYKGKTYILYAPFCVIVKPLLAPIGMIMPEKFVFGVDFEGMVKGELVEFILLTEPACVNDKTAAHILLHESLHAAGEKFIHPELEEAAEKVIDYLVDLLAYYRPEYIAPSKELIVAPSPMMSGIAGRRAYELLREGKCIGYYTFKDKLAEYIEKDIIKTVPV